LIPTTTSSQSALRCTARRTEALTLAVRVAAEPALDLHNFSCDDLSLAYLLNRHIGLRGLKWSGRGHCRLHLVRLHLVRCVWSSCRLGALCTPRTLRLLPEEPGLDLRKRTVAGSAVRRTTRWTGSQVRIVHEPLMIAAEDTGLDERHRRPGRLRLRLDNY